jgi:diguanylate cyclase (GGDEF)-like protein
MESSYEFLSQVLDSITAHIVVIASSGEIKFVNKSWSAFGSSNDCATKTDWSNVNYLDECDKAAAMGDSFGQEAGTGIRRVINNQESIFYFEYPCHSPDEKRWFMMRVAPFKIRDNHYFVITHQNITERILAEEKVNDLARMDGLTNIPNRRTFDQFLYEEWRRCSRLKQPISLAIIDLDHFKLLNDNYGHQTGDDCLVRIGALLKEFGSRPSDICARYGGEEFVVVWSGTPLKQAKILSMRLLDTINTLNIPNSQSPTKKHLTASIGVAELIASRENNESDLISKADRLLYKAKDNGRNRVES